MTVETDADSTGPASLSGVPDRVRLFNILRDDLIKSRPEYAEVDVILCPICLREITLKQFDAVEHIIPQNVLKNDPPFMKILSLSRRAGLTALCHHSRRTLSDEETKHGCNGWKGQKYDRLFKGVIQGGRISSSALKHRHGVAILTMAYLGAFQRLGYGYILRPELDEVRRQFDYPDARHTSWLDHALVNLAAVNPNAQIWGTTSGLPFAFGSLMTATAPLEILFRRFSARLPSGHWAVTHNPDILLKPVLPPPDG